ncbi:riboflavin synthase [Geovibrio ferrireducens]|uniref:riboflavin synthase n=1 Tax=Geovibrio ferrireducens TaxID=46201 RepID=UPI0022469949|nr:riboflavin synthase [Geovibrio ferrireducens]
MFTGIVEETGRVDALNIKGSSAVIRIRCSRVLEDAKIGDSIAVNGVCLTATEITDGSFSADISYETLKRTSLAGAAAGTRVNLERALTLTTRLGGHIVSGHVDGLGTVDSITPKGDSYVLRIRFPEEMDKYIAEKGSVTVDGISLTVAWVNGLTFDVAVIPHTFKETVLSDKRRGDKVNLEADVIARYLEKLMKKEGKSITSLLNML